MSKQTTITESRGASHARHSSRSQVIADLGLEQYVMQLEVDGLCVVPPRFMACQLRSSMKWSNFC
ncbi:MAG: hypothetical protein CM15mP120_19020 [Pseudomonadota bacterium]|nr:MAG: hypothetical protein CM15mP120_19020 [Pseudomonadota bacterium]